MGGLQTPQAPGSDITIPVSVAEGGTGSTTAAGARTALGVPGVPVPVASGGTSSTTAADARTALGLAIGSAVQAYDAILAALVSNGTPGVTGLALLLTTSASAARSAIGAVIGTDVQAYSGNLTSLAAAPPTNWLYGSGSDGVVTIDGTSNITIGGTVVSPVAKVYSLSGCGDVNATTITVTDAAARIDLAGNMVRATVAITSPVGFVIRDNGTAASGTTAGAALGGTCTSARTSGGGAGGRTTVGAGSAGQTAGASTAYGSPGGAGGSGGAGGAAGAAGGATLDNRFYGEYGDSEFTYPGRRGSLTPAGGGGGGSGGIGTGGTTASGAGGGGAGRCVVAARDVSGYYGSFEAVGGNGSAATGTLAGGGGGGGGGMVTVTTDTLFASFPGTISTAGGAKGAGSGGGDGVDGTTGNTRWACQRAA